MSNRIAVCRQCAAKNRIPADKNAGLAKCGKCGASLSDAPLTGTVIHLDDASFHQIVEQSSIPVLVDFFSPTCGPCQMIAPVIDEIAASFAGKAVVCKLDTSRFQNNAARFQIRGVPTLLLFKGGKVVDQIVGAVPRDEIAGRLNSIV